MALEFKSSLTAFDNDQWRKGGMTCNGLKETTQARNYFYGPGRQNLLPDPDSNLNNTTVSQIGLVQTNGLGQIAASDYGPGTLLSTNFSVKHPSGLTDAQIGTVQSTPNKINFVNYRQTDPVLVNSLRNNPLSIYAQGKDVKDQPIPEFFADVNPEDYSTYIHKEEVDISPETEELYIDGSPNVSILGLAQQNPFLGLGQPVPNETPIFSGKVYGGTNSADAKPTAEKLYGSVWDPNHCQNKSLVNFAQGYNVAEQINEEKYIQEGPQAANNLPWGPIRVTGNPQTQQGGIWQRGDNAWPTKNESIGIQNNSEVQLNNNFVLPPKRFVNPYKNGLPGSLIP